MFTTSSTTCRRYAVGSGINCLSINYATSFQTTIPQSKNRLVTTNCDIKFELITPENSSRLIIPQKAVVVCRWSCTHQSNSLETLLQLLLRLSFPQHPLQPADQLRCKLLRLNVNILWHPVCALMGRQ